MTKALVIGGGLAGLTSATYLARGGADVTLLEKTGSAGGRATTSRTNGYALNRGVHALYTGGAASSVLKELNVRYTAGVPKNVKIRADGKLHAFPATPRDLLSTTLLNGAEKRDLLRVFLRIGMVRPSTLSNQSVSEYLSSLTERPAVRSMLDAVARVSLYSDALDIASADTFVLRTQQSMLHPIHYVDGGWQTLVDGLTQAALDAGVTIQPSATVAQLESANGTVTGVRLRDGTAIAADAVILALPQPDAENLTELHQEVLPVYTACLDLALSHLPKPNNCVVFDAEEPVFLTVQSEFARVAPDQGAILHAFLQLDPRTATDAHVAREQLEHFVDEVQPGWREHVVERHFYPHLLASSALPLASRNGMRGRPSPQSHAMRNLYFAGDWVGPDGFLVDASLSSARESARLILQQQHQAIAA
jgi:phytoene dehydrogenase-like protein